MIPLQAGLRREATGIQSRIGFGNGKTSDFLARDQWR